MTAGKVKEEVNGGDGMRSLLSNNFREAGAVMNRFPTSRQEGTNNPSEQFWGKGSFKSGSMAGQTSDGKNLTEGLEYSSSAIDMASHTHIQQLSSQKSAITAPEVVLQASAAEQEEKI